MVSNIKFVKLISQKKKLIYQMHAHLNWNTQIMEDNIWFNSETVICSSLIFMVKVTSGYTEWILTQNCTKEKTTCVNPVGGGDMQFKMSNLHVSP